MATDNKLTKNEIIQRIKDKDDKLRIMDITEVLRLEHEVFIEALREGKEIQIKNQYKIYPYAQKQHNKFNPKEQRSMTIQKRVITKFGLGKELKQATKDLDYDKIEKQNKKSEA